MEEQEEKEYQPESQNVSVSTDRIEISSEPVMDVPAEEQQKEETDLLEKWLPRPPKEECSDELQEKIIKLLVLKKTTGRSFNAELRNKKEYRNPDLLLYTVNSQEIDPIGSRFDKAAFDPHGYDKSDFYDAI
uniref:SAP30-binding protein-like n=1 Tax=Nicotiana tabacum TaxID=4097 RepID=A0A1S4ABS9_TOBAC|nr:PREDICTED: SAP30-binding protein-like [Nicotiana tabacum]